MSTRATTTTPAVLYPLQPDHPELVAPFAALVQRSGARRLWLCQSFKAEPHQVLAHLSGAGYDVPVGTSVSVMPLRHPYEAALQARSLALLTGQPVVAGYGIGTPDFVAALTGEPYKSPRTAVRDYLTSVRDLLDGKAVDHAGPYHHLDARLLPLDHAPVEVGAGVLRAGMARTAGEVADVAITWMTPPAYVRDVLVPALEDGARAAGRPARPRVATAVHVAVARPGRDLRRAALAGAGEHLKGPHYADMLRRAGVPLGDDPAASADALLGHSVVVTGTPGEIAERLAAYRAAGVDEIMLNPAGVMLTEGVQAAVDDMEEIITACG
ncbi:5,10-methylene tetrahydromethanopterin reductase [Streptosporangium nondiastaticum]|uniref:5,10-methylene tetrahydromethanopterin reductase n=1 Tax=Streptosporangium nondiastaticum TaxID=35764 RepID=A0A9X7PFG8_9ACTN|nr:MULTISPECIES: F420-dependent peptide dehydroalanine reductase LxmJ [Actinomycetes]PSJ25841.1 5,10-methylene tetrahydromethanopterin reductase [Streptosporangium nondiastaticum]WKU45659.1 F420-dependent peptide dehydroalanine reductase LxmJ [Streptomyces sp. VNUA116]